MLRGFRRGWPLRPRRPADGSRWILIAGPLDAVVVWNFVATLYPGKLEVVPAGVAYPEVRITVVGLKPGAHPGARDAFLQWCALADAQNTFRSFGYVQGAGLRAGTADR